MLKNAIDWAVPARARQSVLDGKPVALMGATTGISGTANAQRQVREALLFPGAQTLPEELLVARAGEKFDESGELTDPEVRAEVRVLLERLESWVAQVREAIESLHDQRAAGRLAARALPLAALAATFGSGSSL